ncbi:hypothetical protein [Streptococcus anginosus]|uniref:hypothetical protein n=1 Tax=Streptococcus anginosus TaxID=1328 RepID=UPI0039C0D133
MTILKTLIEQEFNEEYKDDKKHLPNLWQVLMKLGKGGVRIALWGLFFLLRTFLFYSLWYNVTHNHPLSLFVGFLLACRTDFL